ncbi:MAG: calcium-translocating P-type ATPase, PMCA-type [Acidobacteriota bacterium]
MNENPEPAKINASSLAHATPVATVIEFFEINPQTGLSAEEITRRESQFGKNRLPDAQTRSMWRALVDQFLSLIVALLLGASLIALLRGDTIEGLAILVVLVVNALVGFATEWQASRALQALRKQARASARVRRNGQETLIDAEELLPGDLVILNAGDRIPADGRLIECANLFAEESALTGESATVTKGVEPVSKDAPLAERSSMLYLGTTIAAGHALMLVTATGINTELGQIGKLLAGTAKESTPLERKLGELGQHLVYIVLGVAAIVFLAGWFHGENIWMMLEVAISLAVAAVPEALPAVTTLILALGVLRMARERAIVRRLSAVETLGSTTIICSDKTGTLTENRMTAREIFLADSAAIHLDEKNPTIEENQLLASAARVALLCNEASAINQTDGKLQTLGDPTETALLVMAHQLGFDVVRERENHKKLFEVPFDTATKRMLTIHEIGDGKRFAALKGAPGVVLKNCSHFATPALEPVPLDEAKRKYFLEINDEMADQALRVLALAERKLEAHEALEAVASLTNEKATAASHNENHRFTFLGFVGMIDPPRAEVPAAIKLAQGAGVRTVMLTGDQINTARAIARELGLSGDSELQALHARDLTEASQENLAELARTATVFARVSPEDKLRIVDALKQAGEIVAVTGDGVNDAPALKRADIGIAMGMRGTDVAREAADVVLADDNFATLIKAIEGGRTIYANITKFVHMMFSHNFAEVLVIFAAILAGLPLPLLPLQILWMNFVTDIFPAFALAVEPPSRGVMKHHPRSPQEALLSRPFLLLIGWQSALLASIAIACYLWALQTYGEGTHARTIALISLINVQLGHFFNCRSRTHSLFVGLFNNPFVWMATGMVIGLQLLAVYFAPLAKVLDTAPLAPTDWYIAAMSLFAPMVIVEVVKAIVQIRKRDQVFD